MDRISVKGYKSFKDLSLKLRKINLLITKCEISNWTLHNKQKTLVLMNQGLLFVGAEGFEPPTLCL